MPKGTPSADSPCFAAHHYVPQSHDKKNKQKQKDRHIAQRYRKERKFVNCVLSQDEYAVLQERAKTDGQTPTAYLRKIAFAYMEQQPIWPKAIEIRLQELVRLLRNMATNLNQIARRTNRNTKLGFFDAFQARKTVLDLEIAFKVFMDNLFRRK
jgi:hypothetical protein